MWDIELMKQSELSLSRQLFHHIRNLIMDNRLTAGEALPSSRYLAKDLTVSRSTVTEAYDMLIAEGYVVSRQGAPTRVKEGLCLNKVSHKIKVNEIHEPVENFPVDFKTGQPDISTFPYYVWKQMIDKSQNKLLERDFGYFNTAGYTPLREEISQWLFRMRGITVDADNVFITTGTTQAINILVHMLYREGMPFAVEDPCHRAIIELLKLRGAAYTGFPADTNGIITDLLDRRSYSAIYVTPSHQFPLGGILPAKRRADLIRYAREQGTYIIEDDYDSEFRYTGAPISPLYSMDSERVIYSGTFSKIMYPAIRIGFVLLPPSLTKQWLHTRKYFDVQNPITEQAALAEFLYQRKLDKYVQKLSHLYNEKRNTLSDSLAQNFKGKERLLGDRAGLHLVLQIEGKSFEEDFIHKSQSLGIRAYPVEEYCLKKGLHSDKLMLGYGHLSIKDIPKKVRVLSDFIKSYGPSGCDHWDKSRGNRL